MSTISAVLRIPFYVMFIIVLAACGGGGGGGGGGGTTAPAAPVAPSGVAVEGGDTEIGVTWSNVSGADSYNLYWSTSPGITTATGTKVTGVASPHFLTGLTNGTTYYVIMAAENSVGESAESSETSAMPGPLPAQVTGVGTTVGDTQISLNWSAAANATTYNIYWSATPGVTPATGTKVAGVTSPANVTGLTNGTTYYFIVVGENATNEGPASAEVSAIPNAIPGQVTGTSGSPGTDQATISWSAVVNATSYNLYWSTSSGVTSGTGTKVAGVTSPYTLTSLTNGITYYFIVTAENSAGEGVASSEVSATPVAPPAAPGNFGVQVGNTELTLTWDSSATATAYHIYWGTSSGVSALNGTKITDVSSPYTHTGLTNDTTYYYVITAENAVGEGTESTEASGVPSDIGWSTQSNVSTDWNLSSYTMEVGDLALSDSNTGFATFRIISGSVWRVYAARFSAGSWSTEENIGGTRSINSKITVDPAGNATAVWVEIGYDEINLVNYSDIWVNRYSAGAWGAPVRVSDTSVGGSDFSVGSPQIVADSNGDVTACWSQSDGTIYNTKWCNRYASGSWGSPVQVSLTGQSVLESTKMDVDGAGNTYLTWTQKANDNSTSENVWISINNGSAWTSPLLIGSALSVGDLVRLVRFDVNSIGDVAVVWHAYTSGVATIEAVTYDASGAAWEAPKSVVSVDPLDIAPEDITLDDNGNVMVFWTQNDTTAIDSIDSAYYATYIIGDAAWSAAQLLENSSDGDVKGIVADIDGSGNVHVAWPQYDPAYVSTLGPPLWSRVYDPVSGWAAKEHRGKVYGSWHMLLDVNSPGNALLYAANQYFSGLTGFWYALDASYYNSGN